jgi:chromosome segregation ATPase
METTLQLILGELKTMNQRMDSIENHMDSMESRMGSMENRMGSMEQKLSDLTEQVKENTLFIHALINGQHKLEQKIDSSIDFMQNLAVRTTTLEHVTGKILYNLADDRR